MAVKIRVQNFQSLKDTRIQVEGFTAITGPNNSGKALAHGTRVATPSGWQPVESLSVGDLVVAGDGSPTRVTGVFPQGERETVSVRFNDGRALRVDLEHLWQVSIGSRRFPKKGEQRWEVLSTREILARVGESPSPYMRPAIPQALPPQYCGTPLPLDPYLMGVLLGDGCFRGSVRLSSGDPEILDEVRKVLPEGVHLSNAGHPQDFRLVTARGCPNPVLEGVRALGLGGSLSASKFIPEGFQFGDVSCRVALLQGLMDSDGTVTRAGGCEYTTVSPRLAEGFRELVWSLGGEARIREKIPKYRYGGSLQDGQLAYTVAFGAPLVPFRLPRKRSLYRPRRRRLQPLMVGFQDAGIALCTCISVGHPSALFQVEGHLVTHNTALMRAVRGVFRNTPGTDFVRHGEQEFTVTLEFEDGRSLAWKKGTTSRHKPTYIIDGGDPIYPGRGVPDEVSAFGVTPIRVMGQDVWPTLAEQFTGQVFLLDQPGSSLAEAVADVERVAKLNGSLRDAGRDLKSARGALNLRKEDEGVLVEQLEGFNGFDEVATLVFQIEDAHLRAGGYAAALVSITDLRDRVVSARDRVQMLEGVSEIRVPDNVKAEALRSHLGELEALTNLWHLHGQAREQVAALEGIEGVAVPSVGTASECLSELESLGHIRGRMVKARTEVIRLEGLEDVSVTDIEGLRAERMLKAIGVIEGFQKRMTDAHGLISQLEKDLEVLNLEAERVGGTVAAILAEFPACPTCGSKMRHEAAGGFSKC